MARRHEGPALEADPEPSGARIWRWLSERHVQDALAGTAIAGAAAPYLAGQSVLAWLGFILLVAFNKPFLATRLGEGVTTVGMPIGLGVILFTVVITAIYVRRANAEFDALSDAIVKGAAK